MSLSTIAALEYRGSPTHQVRFGDMQFGDRIMVDPDAVGLDFGCALLVLAYEHLGITIDRYSKRGGAFTLTVTLFPLRDSFRQLRAKRFNDSIFSTNTRFRIAILESWIHLMVLSHTHP